MVNQINHIRDGTPKGLSPGSHIKVWWQCDEGHSWQAPVYSIIVNGHGCPYCSGKKPLVGETDLATTHPHIAKLWNGKRNVSIMPQQVTAGSKSKVWWQCEKGHEWQAAVFSVVRSGLGCPYCAGRLAVSGENDLETCYPKIAAQWDYERNEKRSPQNILPSAHEKVWWKCELGHSWQAAPFARTREKGSGCPFCTGKKALSGFNDLKTLRPDLAQEWDELLNGGLFPSEITLGSNRKVWWRCSFDHSWQAAVYSRTKQNGTGCPVCARLAKERTIFYLGKHTNGKRTEQLKQNPRPRAI